MEKLKRVDVKGRDSKVRTMFLPLGTSKETEKKYTEYVQKCIRERKELNPVVVDKILMCSKNNASKGIGGGKTMAKKIIVAKLTHDGKKYSGKREVKLYDGNDEASDDANVGLTLRVQRQIRDALKVKYGIKSITSGGVAKDLSEVEAV